MTFRVQWTFAFIAILTVAAMCFAADSAPVAKVPGTNVATVPAPAAPAAAAPVPTASAAASAAVDTASAEPAPIVHPVAVLPFSERGAEVKDLGGKVSDLLFARLATHSELYLVDREDLKKVLGEQELSLSGVVKPDEANKIGQLTGAKILVTGSVMQIDNTIYIVAKAIGTETSRVVGTSVKGKAADDLGSLADLLGDQIAKAMAAQSDRLIAKPLARRDRAAIVKKKIGTAKLPVIMVKIEERHIGQPTIDPAAETEMTLIATDAGFKALNSDADKKDVDVLITGEGFSEFGARLSNLVSVKARVEIKAVDRKTGKVLAIDRQTAVAVDLSEHVAGKTALQDAAAAIAERLLPKLVSAKTTKAPRTTK